MDGIFDSLLSLLNLGTVRLDAHLLNGAGAVFGISRIPNAHTVGVLRSGLFQAGPKGGSRDGTRTDRRSVRHGRHRRVHRLDAAVDARVGPPAGGRDGDAIWRIPEARIIVRRGPVAADHHRRISVRSLREDLIVQRKDQQSQRQCHRQDLQIEGNPPRDAVPRPVIVRLQCKQSGCR